MILVDTSVWIDHFHIGLDALVDVLERGDVVTHPFIIGELACGRLKKRQETLNLLGALPAAIVAADTEVLSLIEQKSLMGRGIGYVDVHLLASVMLTTDTFLWTSDKHLEPVARSLGLTYEKR